MKILVCQLAQRSYHEVLRVLNRFSSISVDLVVFPQLCLILPSQISHIGKLNTHNVALKQISEVARNLKFHVVLGGIITGCENSSSLALNDIRGACVVIDCKGEIIDVRDIRSNSAKSPGAFAPIETVFGLIGLSFCNEIPMAHAIRDSTDYRLILNLPLSKLKRDDTFVKRNPMIERSRWYSTLADLAKQYNTRTGSAFCPCLRVDSPLPFGSGTSMFLAKNSSVFSPHPGPHVFLLHLTSLLGPPGVNPAARVLAPHTNRRNSLDVEAIQQAWTLLPINAEFNGDILTAAAEVKPRKLVERRQLGKNKLVLVNWRDLSESQEWHDRTACHNPFRNDDWIKRTNSARVKEEEFEVLVLAQEASITAFEMSKKVPIWRYPCRSGETFTSLFPVKNCGRARQGFLSGNMSKMILVVQTERLVEFALFEHTGCKISVQIPYALLQDVGRHHLIQFNTNRSLSGEKNEECDTDPPCGGPEAADFNVVHVAQFTCSGDITAIMKYAEPKPAILPIIMRFEDGNVASINKMHPFPGIFAGCHIQHVLASGKKINNISDKSCQDASCASWLICLNADMLARIIWGRHTTFFHWDVSLPHVYGGRGPSKGARPDEAPPAKAWAADWCAPFENHEVQNSPSSKENSLVAAFTCVFEKSEFCGNVGTAKEAWKLLQDTFRFFVCAYNTGFLAFFCPPASPTSHSSLLRIVWLQNPIVEIVEIPEGKGAQPLDSKNSPFGEGSHMRQHRTSPVGKTTHFDMGKCNEQGTILEDQMEEVSLEFPQRNLKSGENSVQAYFSHQNSNQDDTPNSETDFDMSRYLPSQLRANIQNIYARNGYIRASEQQVLDARIRKRNAAPVNFIAVKAGGQIASLKYKHDKLIHHAFLGDPIDDGEPTESVYVSHPSRSVAMLLSTGKLRLVLNAYK